MLNLTKHAHARIQQRGIPIAVVENLLEFGREAHDHHGCRIMYFNRRDRASLRQSWGEDKYKRIERHLDAYAVVAKRGDVVTVGHRTRRIIRY